jgi:hypothetical protein
MQRGFAFITRTPIRAHCNNFSTSRATHAEMIASSEIVAIATSAVLEIAKDLALLLPHLRSWPKIKIVECNSRSLINQSTVAMIRFCGGL